MTHASLSHQMILLLPSLEVVKSWARTNPITFIHLMSSACRASAKTKILSKEEWNNKTATANLKRLCSLAIRFQSVIWPKAIWHLASQMVKSSTLRLINRINTRIRVVKMTSQTIVKWKWKRMESAASARSTSTESDARINLRAWDSRTLLSFQSTRKLTSNKSSSSYAKQKWRTARRKLQRHSTHNLPRQIPVAHQLHK